VNLITPPFERSVFINCPFDEGYSPLLQSIAFCVTHMGFYPRLAPENPDNGKNRLERIIELIRGSKFGIHDLSRCRSTRSKEYARMNMPFELGIDHGCKSFSDGPLSDKKTLILEEVAYDYQKALSDIAGWDIRPHKGDSISVVRIVSDWLVRQAGAERIGAKQIQGDYLTFQEWYWEREKKSGASEDDIKAYPNVQVVASMRAWVDLGGRLKNPTL
jgi:hypothetical protein